MLTGGYKFRNPADICFIAFAVVKWVWLSEVQTPECFGDLQRKESQLGRHPSMQFIVITNPETYPY
jgi:hypothetical protein